MTDIWLEDPLGMRKLLPSELPLTVGGPGAAVVIPGCRPGEIRARVAVSDGRLAVTPEPGAASGGLDGVAVYLDDRDGRPVIVVRHGGVSNVTRPPQARIHDGDASDGDRQPIAVVEYRPRVIAPVRPPAMRRAGGRGLVLAAAAVIGLVLLYLFTATPVQVSSTPAADLDRVDFAGTALDFGIGGRYLVPPGNY